MTKLESLRTTCTCYLASTFNYSCITTSDVRLYVEISPKKSKGINITNKLMNQCLPLYIERTYILVAVLQYIDRLIIRNDCMQQQEPFVKWLVRIYPRKLCILLNAQQIIYGYDGKVIITHWECKLWYACINTRWIVI